jgi:pectin methylesterase-like acyl-CoA thioesterase
VLAVLFAMGASAAEATTRWVDPAAASSPPGTACGTSAGYSTIQAAVNAATPGDTIRVCAGTYPEGPGPLTVNKTLTLLGAQNGVGITRDRPAGDERQRQQRGHRRVHGAG